MPATSEFSEQDRTALRCASFVSELPMPLCDPAGKPLGPRVSALTPWLHNILFLYNSPFTTGTRCTRNQLLQALWILSAGFVVGSRFRFALFCWRWRFLPTEPAIVALREWVAAQFIDRPPSTVDSRPSASEDGPDDLDPRWLASFILARMIELRWSEAEVLHCPYSRLLQYTTELHEARSGEQKPRFNQKRDRQNKQRLLKRMQSRATNGSYTR